MYDTRYLVTRVMKYKDAGQEIPVNEFEQTIMGVPRITYEEAIKYPECLQLADFIRFMFAPTCCYQFDYPQSESIDWIRVI